MKFKDILSIKNISNYIEGNAKYYYNKLVGEPQFLREQRLYRLYMCKDDCLKAGECKECQCPVEKKAFNDESCNEGKRFPDIMNNKAWEEFKVKHNLGKDGENIFSKGGDDK